MSTIIPDIIVSTYFSLACPSEGAPPDLLLYIFVAGSFSAVIQPVIVVAVVASADCTGPALDLGL